LKSNPETPDPTYIAVICQNDLKSVEIRLSRFINRVLQYAYTATGRLSDRTAWSAASLNCCSNDGDVPRTPATTALAHSTYSSRRSTDQSGAGLFATARKLPSLNGYRGPHPQWGGVGGDDSLGIEKSRPGFKKIRSPAKWED
jgi:hypothetical protein